MDDIDFNLPIMALGNQYLAYRFRHYFLQKNPLLFLFYTNAYFNQSTQLLTDWTAVTGNTRFENIGKLRRGDAREFKCTRGEEFKQLMKRICPCWTREGTRPC